MHDSSKGLERFRGSLTPRESPNPGVREIRKCLLRRKTQNPHSPGLSLPPDHPTVLLSECGVEGFYLFIASFAASPLGVVNGSGGILYLGIYVNVKNGWIYLTGCVRKIISILLNLSNSICFFRYLYSYLMLAKFTQMYNLDATLTALYDEIYGVLLRWFHRKWYCTGTSILKIVFEFHKFSKASRCSLALIEIRALRAYIKKIMISYHWDYFWDCESFLICVAGWFWETLLLYAICTIRADKDASRWKFFRWL